MRIVTKAGVCSCGEANTGIACALCSTRVEWSWPPDSSVWAWGDTIPVARYDTLFWCSQEPEVLGPDTCLFYSGDYDPDIFTLRAEVFGPYPPGSSNDPVWYFGGDSLRFWSVKVEVDEALSDRILDVPVDEDDEAETPVKTVFRVLPDRGSSEVSFVESPAAGVTYWHSVSYQPEVGDEVVVKAEAPIVLGELPFVNNRYTLEWEQKDDSANWLDPAHNPYTSRVTMKWERGETRQPVEARGEVECGASGVDLVVKLALPPPYLDELPEADEEGEGRGMLVRLNDDHDAGSDQPDWQLDGPIEEEDDLVLVEVRISEELLAEHPMGATVELEVSGAGRRQVKVWGAKEKGGDRFLLGGYGPYEKSWQLDLSADVEELGPLLERGIWIEGFERPSSRLRDWKLEARVGVGERGARDIVEGTVLRVDLVVTGLAEEDEVEVGCFVPYNHDDDNCNNQQDREEVGPVVFNQQLPGSQNEDNLVNIQMVVEPLPDRGRIALRKVSDRLRFWSAPTKGPSHRVEFTGDAKTWDLGDADDRTAHQALANNLWVEGYEASEQMRDAAVILRYANETTTDNWLADTVKVTVSTLHVYTPTWYPWTDSILPPNDLRLRVVLEAGDSAFSPVGFSNDGEWYRVQTDLGSEPSTDRPRPLGFDHYETLDLSYSQAVPRVDVFGGWSIGVYLWEVQASDESGPNTSIRDYRPVRTELIRGLWAEGSDARFLRAAVGTQRFVARLESPWGVFESPHNEYSTRVSFRGTYPLDPNGREFLRWIATFLGVPYEKGGRWYGGRVGMGTGQGNAYEGYGVDCSGLISAAAEWAGYAWSPWYANTTRLDSTRYSSPIPSSAALPGDILNRAEHHVVAIAHRYGTTDVIDILEAMGTDYPPTERPDNVVRIWPGRDIKRNYVSRGYVPRRLTPQ